MKNATEIAVIIDESGSMERLTDETISSFNKFLVDQQALPGEATMTIVLFSNLYRPLCTNEALAKVKPLSRTTYEPHGYTALYDAVCSTVDAVGAKLAAIPEADRPDKVIVVIITDGDENCSREFNQRQVKERIERQQKEYNWQFIFLGANQDSFTTAGNLGVPVSMTMNYASTPIGTAHAYGAAGQAVGTVRSGGRARLS